MLLRTLVCKYPFEILLISFLLLGIMIILCWTFWGAFKLFSTVAVPLYIYISNAEGLSPHTFATFLGHLSMKWYLIVAVYVVWMNVCVRMCIFFHIPCAWECHGAYVTVHAWKSENNFTWHCPFLLCVLKLRASCLAASTLPCWAIFLVFSFAFPGPWKIFTDRFLLHWRRTRRF